MNIFNSPSNFLALAHYVKDFNGFNEIDMPFILSETVKLKENFVFNIVKQKGFDFISRKFP